MTRYGMVIDLFKCVGCQACVVACSVEHYLPKGVFWNDYLNAEQGTYPNVTRLLMPKNCQHCSNPPCVDVCPTGASQQRADGIVIVDYNKCIGCKYCQAVCPYDARVYVTPKQSYYSGGFTPFEDGSILGSYQHQTGVVEKCTFCVERIEAGVAKGLKPGVDRAATPACVITCITQARFFGDLDDPNSNVSKMVQQKQVVQLLPELGTKPNVYYIPPSKPIREGV